MSGFVVRPRVCSVLFVVLFAGLSLGACDCQSQEPSQEASATTSAEGAPESPTESASAARARDAGSDAATPASRSSRPKSGPETCRSICDTAIQADCSSYTLEQCLGECLQMTQLGMCQIEMEALLGCWASTGPDDFRCDDKGHATTRKGVCADAQSAATECMAVHMAGKGVPTQ